MTTIVNTPGNSDSGGSGLIIGVIVAIVVIALFFLYGLPAMRGNPAPADNGKIDVKVELPAPTGNTGAAPAPTTP